MENTHIPVKIGSQAPAFSLQDENGNWISLSDFKGKKVVLYFYPKDFTPGCTAEACSFRDAAKQYNERGIVVLGVSYDTPASHRKFKDKYQLPFQLLSDINKEVAKMYGAYQGLLKLLVPARKTFLIDENGIIIHIFDNVDVEEHASAIIKIFEHA